MRHFLFLLLYGVLASERSEQHYRFYTQYELDQTPTIAINDVYATTVSSFERFSSLSCLDSQNQHGFASRKLTDEDRVIWQHTELFKVKWFRYINATNSVEITSHNPNDTFSIDTAHNLIVQSEQLGNVETWLYCTREYIGHSMQSVSDSRRHDPSYRGWYDSRSPSWKNDELTDFTKYTGKFKNGRQPIRWRSVPIRFKANVLPNAPHIACYDGMNVSDDKVTLNKCPRSTTADQQQQLNIVYDTPFALDCLAEQGQFDFDDVKWFYEGEPITLSQSSYGALFNVQTVINGKLLDMNGVHLIQGQLHFNRANSAFDGAYYCSIGPYATSPPITLNTIERGVNQPDIFDGRCFYPDLERSKFDVSWNTNLLSLYREREATIGKEIVFSRLCTKISGANRKMANEQDINHERDPFKFTPKLRPGVKNRTHFYESRIPSSFLSNDLLHSSILRLDDFDTFVIEDEKESVYVARPKFKLVSNDTEFDMSHPSDDITLLMEPIIFSQYRTTAEMNKFETYLADTNINIFKRKTFFSSEKGKYWNRNAIYDEIEGNVTITCHIVGLGLDDSDLVWIHNGDKLDTTKFKTSTRSARKINSYATRTDVDQSQNVYCDSLGKESEKKTCLEEQLLISFIPPAMKSIPDWTTDEMGTTFRDSWENSWIPRYYWRMDIELTPEQARGSFQCQAGNVKNGFKSKTTIFFDRSDHAYTPAVLTMSGQSSNNANNAKVWLTDPDPYTFECRLDGLYRSEIERFQWDPDQASSHGDMSERQYHFPSPRLTRNGEDVRMNFAGLAAQRTDSATKTKKLRIETPWDNGGGSDPLVPASMYDNYAYRPIVVRMPGHEQCAVDESSSNEKCDRYQIKYALSYGHMTVNEMGTYSCSFDYVTSSYNLDAIDAKPVFNIKFLSVDVIPDKDESDNRRGVLIKWTVPLMDPCWSPLENDPGLDDSEREKYDQDKNEFRGGLSKEEYLTELRENCKARSVKCDGAKDNTSCISLNNLRVHFYMAIIPYLSMPYHRSIDISGLNKRRNTNYSKEDIMELLVANETDCEHGLACHVERGFYKSRCETLTTEEEKQECSLLVANGMMKYTCGCTSFHDIVHEDIKPSIQTSNGGEIVLEPPKPDANQRKLARGAKYMVKIHAEKLASDPNGEQQLIEQIIYADGAATFVTPSRDLAEIRAPEIDRILPLANYATFYLRESVIAATMTHSDEVKASICWQQQDELNQARLVEETDGDTLSPNAVLTFRCHDFDIVQREVRIGPFAPKTKFFAYVEVTVDAVGEIIADKSLIGQFETDDYIEKPNSPLGLESFIMIPSPRGMSYKWEEPYAEANQYIRMTTWNGTEKVVYRFNPGEATVTKKCDEHVTRSKSRKCYHKFKYAKPTTIEMALSNVTSMRSSAEMFDFRNIQSNTKHAVFLNNATVRSETEQTVLPPCSMIGGQWESSNKVRLEWNCPNVSLSVPNGSHKARKENDIAVLLNGLPKVKDNLYFHIRWTTDLWSQNHTGWFLPFAAVANARTRAGSYSYIINQDVNNVQSPKKSFEKILNECQVLNFQVRLLFFPSAIDAPYTDKHNPHPCLESVNSKSYNSIHKLRRLLRDGTGGVNCRQYAGSTFSDTLALRITPRDTLLPPEYEYSYIKNDRITLTTVKKLSHDCRQHYIQVQIRVKDKNRVENVNAVNELDTSKKNKNESDKKEYEFPDDVYHSCYTLTSNKEETFRFDQFTRGEKKDKGLKFNQLPLDANGKYEIAVRRGRGQNNIETNKNTCSNYKEGQHSPWTEWIEIPVHEVGSKSTTTPIHVASTQSSTSGPLTAANDECWLHKKFQYSCDVTDILLVVVAVLVVLVLLMFIYILYKLNCWCQTHDNDYNGNLPILNNSTPKYIKTEFSHRPPDHNNRFEDSTGLLLPRPIHEETNNELSNSTSELTKGPSITDTDLDVRSVPIRRSIQHRQPNLIQPTPQLISKQSNSQQYEENVHPKSLPKDTNQTCGSLESPLIPPHLPEKQTNMEEKSDETDSFPSSNSSLYCDPKEKLIHSQATILAPSQVLAALETTT